MTFPASSKAFSSLRSPTKTLPDFPSAPRLTRTSNLCSTCKQGQSILDQPGCSRMGSLHPSGIDERQVAMVHLSQVDDRLPKDWVVEHVTFHPLAERFGYCPDCQCKDFEQESRHTLSRLAMQPSRCTSTRDRECLNADYLTRSGCSYSGPLSHMGIEAAIPIR